MEVIGNTARVDKKMSERKRITQTKRQEIEEKCATGIWALRGKLRPAMTLEWQRGTFLCVSFILELLGFEQNLPALPTLCSKLTRAAAFAPICFILGCMEQSLQR